MPLDKTKPTEVNQSAISQVDNAMKTYLQFLVREVVKKLKEKQDRLKATTECRSQP